MGLLIFCFILSVIFGLSFWRVLGFLFLLPFAIWAIYLAIWVIYLVAYFLILRPASLNAAMFTLAFASFGRQLS
jgi:hypothetical protein